jgi:hypothetical protein
VSCGLVRKAVDLTATMPNPHADWEEARRSERR